MKATVALITIQPGFHCRQNRFDGAATCRKTFIAAAALIWICDAS
jgi:hypothetical protein